MRIAWGARVDPPFRKRVAAIAAEVGCFPGELMACMAFETGRTFSPSIRNAAGSGAVGLIQFTPKTLERMGYTVEQVAAMTQLEQLDVVLQYLRPYAGRLRTLADVYMAILMPSAIGKPDDAVLITDETSKAYIQNKGLDLNHDGNITKAEAADHVQALAYEGMRPGNVWDDMEAAEVPADKPEAPPQGEPMPSALDSIASIAGLFNPLAGAGLGLAAKLFEAYQPVLQDKIAKEVNRHTDDPSIGQQVAAQLGAAAIEQAKALTGKTDAFDAVAAARASPEVLQTLQTNTDAELDRMIKAADKSSGYDQAMWAAMNTGKQTVSSIAIEEHKAGLWDMTRSLVYTAAAAVLGLNGGLMYIMGKQLIAGKDINAGVLGMSGPIFMASIAAFGAIIAYRFDGNKESSMQTKALIDATKK